MNEFDQRFVKEAVRTGHVSRAFAISFYKKLTGKFAGLTLGTFI